MMALFDFMSTGYYILSYCTVVVRQKWEILKAYLPMCRCPGRQVWRTLQIEDCRHIDTVEAMFEQICKHIKQSTNNGIIIPTISIFPARKFGKQVVLFHNIGL